MCKLLLFFILGLCIELLQVNGDSYTVGCTATCTATCPITAITQGSNDCKGNEHKLQQLAAKLDRLMAHENVTYLYYTPVRRSTLTGLIVPLTIIS